MSKFIRSVAALVVIFLVAAGIVWAEEKGKDAPKTGKTGEPLAIALKLSGKGVVNDSTVKAGEPFSVDIYFANDKHVRGFTAGLKVSSADIKTITHPSDSGKGINENGDIKGYNGWQDNSIWDLTGLKVAKTDWDGTLPDVAGFLASAMKKTFDPQGMTKNLSMDLVVSEPGTLVIDSCFYPPSNSWKFITTDNRQGMKALWKGPYHFKVVK